MGANQSSRKRASKKANQNFKRSTPSSFGTVHHSKVLELDPGVTFVPALDASVASGSNSAKSNSFDDSSEVFPSLAESAVVSDMSHLVQYVPGSDLTARKRVSVGNIGMASVSDMDSIKTGSINSSSMRASDSHLHTSPPAFGRKLRWGWSSRRLHKPKRTLNPTIEEAQIPDVLRCFPFDFRHRHNAKLSSQYQLSPATTGFPQDPVKLYHPHPPLAFGSAGDILPVSAPPAMTLSAEPGSRPPIRKHFSDEQDTIGGPSTGPSRSRSMSFVMRIQRSISLRFDRQQDVTNNNSIGVGQSMEALGFLARSSAFPGVVAVPQSESHFDWMKERLKTFTQLSGHAGTVVPASNQSVFKKCDSNEGDIYEGLMADGIAHFVPTFVKRYWKDGDHYVELEDVTSMFGDSFAIMDVKMGIRTYLEAEVSNNTLRPDLYKKMICIDGEVTEEERRVQSMTKLRYMQYRENLSSTPNLGFRIDAMKRAKKELKREYAMVKQRQQVIDCLKIFLEGCSPDLYNQALSRLLALRNAFEKSQFLKRHEVIGSSLLFIYNENKLSIWMIDFAKTIATDPSLGPLDHRLPWTLGNHEDGYLFGLDNLIEIFGDKSWQPQ